MSNKKSLADDLWSLIDEFIKAMNKECERQKADVLYKVEIIDGRIPLKSGNQIIKHYKTLNFIIETNDGNFQLYQSHIPLKSKGDAITSKAWQLRLLKDMLYQAFTNFGVYAYHYILSKEAKERETKKQIGRLITPTGEPLTKESGTTKIYT